MISARSMGLPMRRSRGTHAQQAHVPGTEVPLQRDTIAPAIALTPLGEWVQQAACAGHPDPTIFDLPEYTPGDGRSTRTHAEQLAAFREAAQHCRRCPVAQQCLDDARENGNTGIRGGLLLRDSKPASTTRNTNLVERLNAGRLNPKGSK